MTPKLRKLFLTLLASCAWLASPAIADDEFPEESMSGPVAEILKFAPKFKAGTSFDQAADIRMSITVDIPALFPTPVVCTAEDQEKQKIHVMSVAEGNSLPIVLKSIDGGSTFKFNLGAVSIVQDKKHETPRMWTLDERYDASEDLFMPGPWCGTDCGDDGVDSGDSSDGCGDEGCECGGVCCEGNGDDVDLDDVAEFAVADAVHAVAGGLREVARPMMLSFSGAFQHLLVFAEETGLSGQLNERGIALDWNVERHEQVLLADLTVASDKIALDSDEVAAALGYLLMAMDKMGVAVNWELLESIENPEDIAGFLSGSARFNGRWNEEAGLVYDLSCGVTIDLDLAFHGQSAGKVSVTLDAESFSNFLECCQ